MNDGGPAFPCPDRIIKSPFGDFANDLHINGAAGMTLLDWFAGQVLVGLISDPKKVDTPENFAKACYTMAAAMLAEKNRITAQVTPASHPSLPER